MFMSIAKEARQFDCQIFSKVNATLSESSSSLLLRTRAVSIGYGHNYFGTDHMLLALLYDKGINSRLNNAGLKTKVIKEKIYQKMGRGENTDIKIDSYSPAAWDVLSNSVYEARLQESQQNKAVIVEPKHFLLGLIDNEEGIGVGILKSMGINLENIRKEMLK